MGNASLSKWLPRSTMVAWIAAVTVGFGMLGAYKMRAGNAASAPAEWPSGQGYIFDRTRLNVILFAHPMCPCTRATLAELEEILTRTKDVRVTICFLALEDMPPEWTDSALVRDARRLDGVDIRFESISQLEKKFGPMTSGQAIAYNRDRRLVFSGGITGSRGHAGDNLGRETILKLASGKIAYGASTPVYGCSLDDAPPGNGISP